MLIADGQPHILVSARSTGRGSGFYALMTGAHSAGTRGQIRAGGAREPSGADNPCKRGERLRCPSSGARLRPLGCGVRSAGDIIALLRHQPGPPGSGWRAERSVRTGPVSHIAPGAHVYAQFSDYIAGVRDRRPPPEAGDEDLQGGKLLVR
jgi:hypothetical protein